MINKRRRRKIAMMDIGLIDFIDKFYDGKTLPEKQEKFGNEIWNVYLGTDSLEKFRERLKKRIRNK